LIFQKYKILVIKTGQVKNTLYFLDELNFLTTLIINTMQDSFLHFWKGLLLAILMGKNKGKKNNLKKGENRIKLHDLKDILQ